MRQWRRYKKNHCPLCSGRLSRNRGKLECPTCNIVIVGDSCRFLDLTQMILERHGSRKR